jgi:hypothetical protein
MEKFTIYFDTSSNEKWGVNSDFYDIYIKLGNFAFPGRGWTDLALYCIDDWSQGFVKLLSKEEKSVVGRFYDNLLAENDEKGKIQLVAEDEGNKILKESYINLNQAVSTLLGVIDIIIEKEPTKAKYWENMKSCLTKLSKSNLEKF